MATKLSEFLKQHNMKIEDLEDDEVGLPIPELRKRYAENQKNYTQATQAMAQQRQQVEQWQGQWQQAWQQAEQEKAQLTGRLQQLEQMASQRAQQVQSQGGDWRKDPLFQDIAGEFDRTAQHFTQQQEGIKALANAVVTMAQEYQRDRSAFVNYVQQNELREFKRANPDVDIEAVRQTAREMGINDWNGALKAHQGKQLPDIEKQAEQRGREAAMKEAAEKFGSTTQVTEMGEGRASAPPVGGQGQKPSYDGAFDKLGKELQAQGIT